MPDPFPDDVFLSRSAKDKAVVRASSLSASNGERAGVRCRSLPWAERLRQNGLTVWFDEWIPSPAEAGEGGQRPGEGRGAEDDSIPAKIEEGLPLFALQPSAFSLQPLPRAPLNQERCFIPLRLDHAPNCRMRPVQDAHCNHAELGP